MKFGAVPVKDCVGAILAHSMVLPNGKRIRKGQVLSDELVRQLDEAGIDKVTVAKIADNDVLEDEAAARIASQICGNNLRVDEARTGRVNFFARVDGLFCVCRDTINAINAVDPAITIATLDDFSAVSAGRMVATIKIIPYAVSLEALEQVLALHLEAAFRVAPYKAKRIGLIATTLPSLKPATIRKTRENLEKRLAHSGSVISKELCVEHSIEPVCNAIKEISGDCDMVIVFGASAISDMRDVIPEAIRFAGGDVIRFGMPVDPGNLLLLAEFDEKPVIGAPGCARSPAENGFDWVLQRLLAGFAIHEIDVAGLGVGGLLMETGSRPHSRVQPSARKADVTAIILAAGQSRRMGSENKMTMAVQGKPMVRNVVVAALSSNCAATSVVTGHKPQETIDALDGLEFSEVHNPAFADGLSTSLAAGISAVPDTSNAAIVLLGDMPFISADMINTMLQTAEENPGHIIMATHDGKRGNPVLWPARFFDELCHVKGDVGARHIIGANADFVVEVELGPAASLDLDTPEAVYNVG